MKDFELQNLAGEGYVTAMRPCAAYVMLLLNVFCTKMTHLLTDLCNFSRLQKTEQVLLPVWMKFLEGLVSYQVKNCDCKSCPPKSLLHVE